MAGRGAGAASPPPGVGDGVAGSCAELELRGGQAGAAVTCPQAGVTEARGMDVLSARGWGLRVGCAWLVFKCPAAVVWLGQWSLATVLTWSVSSPEPRFPHSCNAHILA